MRIFAVQWMHLVELVLVESHTFKMALALFTVSNFWFYDWAYTPQLFFPSFLPALYLFFL